jgi:hypothetical protein
VSKIKIGLHMLGVMHKICVEFAEFSQGTVGAEL